MHLRELSTFIDTKIPTTTVSFYISFCLIGQSLHQFLSFFLLANTAPCEQGLDLAILLDQSLSVRRRNLKALLKTLLPPYIEMLRISPRKTHVGFIRFHRTSHLDFNFADHRFDSTKKLKSEINSIDPVTFYKTRIDRGLLSARYEMFTKRAGDRTSKQNVLLVFTDGKPFPRHRVLPFNETIPPLRVRY